MRALLVPLRLKAIPAIDRSCLWRGGAVAFLGQVGGGGTYLGRVGRVGQVGQVGRRDGWVLAVVAGWASDSSDLSDLSDLSD